MVIIVVNQQTGSRKEYLYSYGSLIVLKHKASQSSAKNHQCTFTVADEKKGYKVHAVYYKGVNQLS